MRLSSPTLMGIRGGRGTERQRGAGGRTAWTVAKSSTRTGSILMICIKGNYDQWAIQDLTSDSCSVRMAVTSLGSFLLGRDSSRQCAQSVQLATLAVMFL
jgi:hypothetical protein